MDRGRRRPQVDHSSWGHPHLLPKPIRLIRSRLPISLQRVLRRLHAQISSMVNLDKATSTISGAHIHPTLGGYRELPACPRRSRLSTSMFRITLIHPALGGYRELPSCPRQPQIHRLSTSIFRITQRASLSWNRDRARTCHPKECQPHRPV